MKYILYEIRGLFDVVLQLTFLKEAWLNNYIKLHTEENKYVPRFLVLELDDNDEIDYVSEYLGKDLKYRKCLAEYIE